MWPIRLLPRTSEMERGGVAYATSYDDRQITITTTAADGTTSSRTINRSGPIIDNDQSLQVQRALPLADGYAAHYRGLVANTGAQFTTNLRVAGAENVTTERRLAVIFAADALLAVYSDGRITRWPFTEEGAGETVVGQIPVVAPYLDLRWAANAEWLAAK